MSYSWDEHKAASNSRKHGVDFADAVIALEDDLALTVSDDGSEDEERYLTLGTDPLGRLLVVVWTEFDTEIRVISARKATRHERRQYEGEP